MVIQTDGRRPEVCIGSFQGRRVREVLPPQSLGIPRYVRARLMVFTLLLGKLKPSRRPREAIWVGNTYPLGGAKNFTMLQEVGINPIRTPWENSKVFIIVSRVTYPGICTPQDNSKNLRLLIYLVTMNNPVNVQRRFYISYHKSLGLNDNTFNFG